MSTHTPTTQLNKLLQIPCVCLSLSTFIFYFLISNHYSISGAYPFLTLILIFITYVRISKQYLVHLLTSFITFYSQFYRV